VYNATAAGSPGRVVYTAPPGSPPSIPDWYRADLENEYRALMMRVSYLRAVLGKN